LGKETTEDNWGINADLLKKYYDTQNSHLYDELDVVKGPDGKVTGAQIVPDQRFIDAGAAIGQIFGSALGNALGGKDQLTKLASSVVGGTIGSLIGQKFGLVVATSMAADLSKVSLIDVFALKNIDIANAGLGAISSFLTAELGSALKIGGFGEHLFDAAANGFTLSVLTQVSTKIGAGLTFDAAISAIDWSAAVSGAIDVTGLHIENLFGTFLGQLLVPAKSHAGAIGGQLLGAIGSLIVPGLGSFIGSILGTVIGDLFGSTPHPAATDLLDQAGYLYAATHYQTSEGGSYSVPDQMADPALAIINGYLNAVKGAALDHSKQVTIGYQTAPQSSYIIGVPSHPAAGVFYATGYAVQAAAVDVLQHTEVIGGDLLLKRGHHNSSFYDPPPMPPADPSGDPGPTGAPIQPIATTQLAILSGDLGVAQDYEKYLNNREAINALMAANPDSAFTAGWIATFARVSELKLNQTGPSDFLGGLVGYLDSVGKAGLGFDAANVAVTVAGNGLTVQIKVPNGTEVPGALAAFASQESQSSDATGTTVKLTFSDFLASAGFHGFAASQGFGDAANDWWFGADVPNNFNASASAAAILIGGASTDTLTGGNGWDFLDGGAGNDILSGGAGNDILRGGPGNDQLYGGLGNDTYVLARGDGADIAIDSGGGSDTLAFGAGIRVSDLQLQLDGSNLIVGLKNPATPGVPASQLADRITLTNWNDPLARIENFQFADGSTISISAIFAHGGTPGADALTWTDSVAWLDGGSGDDVLRTGAFNDTLRGGPGNDLLIGGAGTDTAVYDGPASAYTLVSYSGTVGVLSHGGDGNDRLQGIETIAFADRTLAAAAVAMFDPWEYLASNADLIAAFGPNPQAGYDHYVNSGFNEGRATASFDPLEYLASNPGMIGGPGVTPAWAVQHYVSAGYFEHRATTSFDAVEYLASNPDLIAAGYTPSMALQHYVSSGYFEHRPTTSFDPAEYLASNPDLIQAGTTPASAAQQYVSAGYVQHRAIASFDAAEYLASNPDLIAAGGQLQKRAHQAVIHGPHTVRNRGANARRHFRKSGWRPAKAATTSMACIHKRFA
jgi:Ca2+-binding RTX toxin-like protein